MWDFIVLFIISKTDANVNDIHSVILHMPFSECHAMIVQSYESLFLTFSADVTISVFCAEVLKQADKKKSFGNIFCLVFDHFTDGSC